MQLELLLLLQPRWPPTRPRRPSRLFNLNRPKWRITKRLYCCPLTMSFSKLIYIIYRISFIEVWNRPQRFFKEHASFLLNAAWSLLYIEKHHPLLTPFYSWVLTSQNFPSPSKTYSQYMWYKMSVEDERKTLYQNWICSFCLESRWSLWRNQTIDSFLCLCA